MNKSGTKLDMASLSGGPTGVDIGRCRGGGGQICSNLKHHELQMMEKFRVKYIYMLNTSVI